MSSATFNAMPGISNDQQWQPQPLQSEDAEQFFQPTSHANPTSSGGVSGISHRSSAAQPGSPFRGASPEHSSRGPAHQQDQASSPSTSGHSPDFQPRHQSQSQVPNAALVKHRRAVLCAQCGVLAMLFAWFIAIFAGYVDHADSDEKPHPDLVKLPLLWFDRQILRRIGPFVPFIIVAIRSFSNLPAFSIHGREISFNELATLYVGITAARWLIYVIHAAEALNWVNRIFPAQVALSDHMMSDHVFLTASIAAIFMCESVFLLHHVSYMWEWRVVPRSMKRQKTQMYLATVLCFTLYGLVVLDTYYSTRYFHWRTHNNSAAFLGFMAFKLPVLFVLGR